MKKVRLFVEEKLTYNHELVIEVEEGMDEDRLNSILDQVQYRADYFGDISYLLRMKGIKVINEIESDLSSPMSSEIEITDYDFEE